MSAASFRQASGAVLDSQSRAGLVGVTGIEGYQMTAPNGMQFRGYQQFAGHAVKECGLVRPDKDVLSLGERPLLLRSVHGRSWAPDLYPAPLLTLTSQETPSASSTTDTSPM